VSFEVGIDLKVVGAGSVGSPNMKISKIPLRRKWSRGQAVAAGKSIHVAAEVQSSGGRLFKDRASDRVFSDKEGSRVTCIPAVVVDRGR
jgi:hypothetical protein